MTIRPQIEELKIIAQEPAIKPVGEGEDQITVSSATRRIAFAYERFRNVLEPDEADILRRKSIYRILERRLPEDRPTDLTAKFLLQELMRANYIPAQPVTAVPIISAMIKSIESLYHELPKEAGLTFLQIAAVAIDRHFFPRRLQEALVNQMYQDLASRVVWADDLLPEPDRLPQLYIASHRTLFAADDYELFYHFFINQYPDWQTASQTNPHFSVELPPYFNALATQIFHHDRERMYRILRPSAVPYRILLDLIKANQTDIWQDEAALQKATREAIGSRIKKIQASMSRRAWHSILFLFFTKTIVALLLELPYELFLLGAIKLFPLAVNILFHPLLLFFSATIVRMPGESNANKIIDHVTRLTQQDGVMPTVVIQKARHYGTLTWAAFATFYTLLFLFIFWRLFIFLSDLQFSILGILIFVVFLGLVSFLATRIRRSVNDIRVIPKKEGLLGLIFSFLSLPILEFGRYLTTHISQLNILLFAMDLILEAPFKLLIDIIEEWFTFIRDRKEEIV